MAKFSKDKIKKKDIENYLATFSDFAFELKALKILSSLGLACSHAGTYTDPISGKIREYDIRGNYERFVKNRFFVRQHFAVECKNLNSFFPLVVHCVKRNRIESFLDCIVSCYNKISFGQRAITIKTRNDLHRYQAGEPVGKSIDQVGRQLHDSEIVASDGNVFEKISQAISSSKELIDISASCGRGDRLTLSFINPILVVPDETLWMVMYDENGNVVSGPEETKFINYAYNKEWPYIVDGDKRAFSISHLDIVTIGALDKYISNIINIDEYEFCDYYKKITDETTFPGISK